MLPPTRSELSLGFHLFERVLGTKELVKVEKLQVGETLLLDVGTTITSSSVVSISEDVATIRLGRPICAEEGSGAAVSRRIAGRWRLIGYGVIKG